MDQKSQKKRKKIWSVNGQSVSMGHRLLFYWLSMILTAFTVLILVLSLFGVFSSSSKNLHESLSLQQQNTVTSLKSHIDVLDVKCISLSKKITGEITDTLLFWGKSFEDINDDEQLIVNLEEKIYKLLDTTLRSSECSGVFCVLDATCNTGVPQAEDSRMGLYLRYSDLSGVNTVNTHVAYFRGSPEVARKENVPMHNRWNLEFDTGILPGYEKMMNTSATKMAYHCLWTERVNLKDNCEDVTLMCVPILDGNGTVRGICGIELSDLYFQLSYPASDSAYGCMTAVFASMEDNVLNLDKAMIGETRDDFLNAAGSLVVNEGKYYNTYESDSEDYVGLHRYLMTHTVDGKQMVVVTLLSKDGFQDAISRERRVWIMISLVFLVIMLAVSWFMSRHFMIPISRLSEAIREEKPINGEHCGISEIDELVDYIQNISQVQNDKGLPPNIEELFHDFSERVATLTPMERTVLQYYIEGCSIEEVAARAYISINTVKKHNTNINRKLGVATREELTLYIDLFRRCGRMEDITYQN